MTTGRMYGCNVGESEEARRDRRRRSSIPADSLFLFRSDLECVDESSTGVTVRFLARLSSLPISIAKCKEFEREKRLDECESSSFHVGGGVGGAPVGSDLSRMFIFFLRWMGIGELAYTRFLGCRIILLCVNGRVE